MRILPLLVLFAFAHAVRGQGSVPELQRATDDGRRVYDQRIVRPAEGRPRIWPMAEVDVAPRHPEGEAALLLHFANAEGCSNSLVEADCMQRTQVMLHFVVAPDGSVSGIRTEEGVCASLAAMVRCAAARLPRLEPGEKDGVPVHVRMQLPIRIELR